MKIRNDFRQSIIAIPTLITLFIGTGTGCSSDDVPMKKVEPVEPVGTLISLTLAPGSAWNNSLSLEEQAMGPLAPHGKEIEARFGRGELVANAFRGDGLGFYIYDGDAVAVQQLSSTDPAIQSNILSVFASERWTLFIENMGQDIGSEQTFILEYKLGGKATDAPFLEQDIANHSSYLGGLFENGRVLAGGVVGLTSELGGTERRARYIIMAPDQSAADKIISKDPSVVTGTLIAKAVLWGNPSPFPTHFHRRSLADTRSEQ